MKIQYKNIRFSHWKMEMIEQAAGIVDDYAKQGYDLTLRQVYYQFVSRDWFPEFWKDPATGSTNNQKSYTKLGNTLSDARMAGVLDWNCIVDRTRQMGGNTHWKDPAEIIGSISRSFNLDKWAGQKFRPEIWVEKDALEGVIGKCAKRLDIPYFSCRGYTSATSMWENAQRMKQTARDFVPVVLHLGDHDPSGIDMSRDIENRTRLFMDDLGDRLIFERIALNMKQIKQYKPPVNPAKNTDSRYKKYVEEHGNNCWELDALEPKILDDLISKRVAHYCDAKSFNQRMEKQEGERAMLQKVSDKWDHVFKFLKKGK